MQAASSIELVGFNPRAREATSSSSRIQSRKPASTPKLAPVRPSAPANGKSAGGAKDRDAAFGERKRVSSTSTFKGKAKNGSDRQERMALLPGGGAEISWVPSKGGTGDDSIFDDGRGIDQTSKRKERDGGGSKVETFGAGMERGRVPKSEDDGRTGRTKRRINIRSGSRNTFRQM